MTQIICHSKIKIPLPSLKKIVGGKRSEQKYLILLSDQTTIIGNEWEAMKKAVRSGKPIVEMLPTDARVNTQTTGLSKLLESLEIKNDQ